MMITGKTFVIGIIGYPVEHSLSPPMHNAAFKHLGMDFVYVPFPVKRQNLEKSIKGAGSLGIKGLNVTIPHKTEVLPYLDELDQAAELIGAVNTIKFTGEYTEGFNTDGVGAVHALQEATTLKDKKIVLLGSGGAARAIAFQLVMNGVGELLIANRTVDNALKLSESLDEKLSFSAHLISFDELEKELDTTDILVNTTPVGMYPRQDQDPLVTCDMMHQDLVVNDIVYNPLKTKLLMEAEKAGARTINGSKMLVYQGVESFRIWTGISPPVEVFHKTLMKTLKS